MWTTHVLTVEAAEQVTSDLKQELSLTRWYGLATDETSDKDDKFLPVLLRYVDNDSGLIATSLLDMPNVNSGPTAQQMCEVCNEVREAFSLG